MAQPAFRSMEEAVVDMLRWYAYASGITPDSERGSVLRTLFEAWGYEVEQQSWRFDTELRAAIPEAVFDAFGFARIPAQAAVTTLTFARAAPAAEEYLIPAGTLVSTAGNILFQTTADTTIPIGGTSADAPAEAITAGASGNVGANTITVPTALAPGVETVTNPQAAYGGADAETLTAQRDRFAAYLATLAKGTIPALTATALTVQTGTGERAAKVVVVDNYIDNGVPSGEAYVYVYTPTGATQDLLDAIFTKLEQEQRPVGVRLTMQTVTPDPHTINLTITGSSASVIDAVKVAAQEHIEALAIGEDINVNRLIAAALATDPTIYTATGTVVSDTTSTAYAANQSAPIATYAQATASVVNVSFVEGGAQ